MLDADARRSMEVAAKGQGRVADSFVRYPRTDRKIGARRRHGGGRCLNRWVTGAPTGRDDVTLCRRERERER